ncbi:hypothetical protein M0802_015251 [Mischocyttarus mexicanus]|nr:hypothetical protein M0802_015254 [Mischocyttarus mexicanus]KAI4475192.1 hypothetical protein M0802_015251 [Mischocyttarus mexicanus]
MKEKKREIKRQKKKKREYWVHHWIFSLLLSLDSYFDFLFHHLPSLSIFRYGYRVNELHKGAAVFFLEYSATRRRNVSQVIPHLVGSGAIAGGVAGAGMAEEQLEPAPENHEKALIQKRLFCGRFSARIINFLL